MHYNISGQGKPLVFLHGFLEDASIWDGLKPHFEQAGYCVITFDLPCHGKSRFNGKNCSMTEMADEVFNVLLKFKFFNPVVIGHSMGGYVALELLRNMACHVILLHSNFWEDPLEKKKDRNRVIELVKTKSAHFITEAIPALFAEPNKEKCSETIQSLIEKAKKIPPDEIAAATAGMRDRKPAYKLVDRGSVYIIQGDSDPIIPISLMESELSKIAHQPSVITIPNCGHMGMWENQSELIAAINKLLIEEIK
ncbi:alpha/beta hydrolase [Paracrocinitomix mangrovi]|uniref:alpha/beta fold hydrolase n=1 Tax=Paracrocinitomix mangrovi TaxID=2862509 RepID=UPI001C8F14CE|nr:alpha/beta hydrolase [Paracrocinitomix mangrovi]UKN00429.1 alpha/beta hydrolase [Paracrocinitomix mangrovi]